jgi:hypothetical protein
MYSSTHSETVKGNNHTSCVIAVLKKESFVLEAILVFEYLVYAKSAALLPGFTGNRSLLLIYLRGIRGCQYLSSDYLRLGIPSSVQLHPYSVLCIACGFHVAEDSPVPNHGFFCFASMPQRIVENEQGDIALLKSR